MGEGLPLFRCCVFVVVCHVCKFGRFQILSHVVSNLGNLCFVRQQCVGKGDQGGREFFPDGFQVIWYFLVGFGCVEVQYVCFLVHLVSASKLFVS